MRFSDEKCYFPACVWMEPMPHKDRVVLIYLFSLSKFKGECRPGIKGLMEAVQQSHGHLGCPKQMKSILDRLQKSGWVIERKRKRSGNAEIHIQIPIRYRKPVSEPKVKSNVVKFRIA